MNIPSAAQVEASLMSAGHDITIENMADGLVRVTDNDGETIVTAESLWLYVDDPSRSSDENLSLWWSGLEQVEQDFRTFALTLANGNVVLFSAKSEVLAIREWNESEWRARGVAVSAMELDDDDDCICGLADAGYDYR